MFGSVSAFATTSMVCDIESDIAMVSDVGVDDHSLKFPGTTETASCACVSSCCLKVVFVVCGFALDASEAGLSCSLLLWYEVLVDGALSNSMACEPDPSLPSTRSLGAAPN